jgi:hypothetical protein
VFLAIPFVHWHLHYPLLLQPPYPRAWLVPSRHLPLEALVRSYQMFLLGRSLLALLLPGRWRGYGGVQRPSHPVVVVRIVYHPCPVGARRSACKECPCCPASTRLGWSQR